MALFRLVLGIAAAASPALAAVASGDATTMAVDGAGTVHRSDSTGDGQNMMRRQVPRMETKVATDAGSILETSSSSCAAAGGVPPDDRVVCPAGLCTCEPGKVLWYHAGEKKNCVEDGVRPNGLEEGVHFHYGRRRSDTPGKNCNTNTVYVPAATPPINDKFEDDRDNVKSSESTDGKAGNVRQLAQCMNNVGWMADAENFGPQVLCGGPESSRPCPEVTESNWPFRECRFSRDGQGMREGMWCCSGDHHMCVLKCPSTPSSDDEPALEVKCGMDRDTPQTTFLRGMDVCKAQSTKTCEMQSEETARYRACQADEWWERANSVGVYQGR